MLSISSPSPVLATSMLACQLMTAMETFSQSKILSYNNCNYSTVLCTNLLYSTYAFQMQVKQSNKLWKALYLQESYSRIKILLLCKE